MKKKIILTALAVLALFGTAFAPAQVSVGSPAPGFTLPDAQGVSRSLSEFSGKVVILEWTNPDCPFVKKHYDSKNMQALQEKYIARGAVWLSICSSAPGKQGHYSAAEWNDILGRQGSRATALLLDPEGRAGLAYAAKTTPHMFVIDAEGTLVYDGAIDDQPSTRTDDIPGAKALLADAADAALAGQPVPVPKTAPYGCSVKY
ncbi:MAG TPA: redoxin domain-containing protein [Kiritimatiellia bacterium]|nr:redoxin domain-containing protein [Kiritimatiellia bacterium]